MKAASIVSLISGLCAGVVLVLSCADDSPSNADAAMCDCSAAEPPIRRRIQTASSTREIAANDRGSQFATCPGGGLLISGSCTTMELNPVRNVTLEQAGFFSYDPDLEMGWYCRFRNNEATPVTIKATAICLMPGS